MNQVSTQHPAVVLRSHYVHLRSLLAIAMIAVVGLTAAVVVLASGDNGSASRSASSAARVSAPAQTTPGLRFDGGPDEGTRGPTAALRSPGVRFDGGPEEGTRGELSGGQRP